MTAQLLERAIDELRRLPCRYSDPRKCEHCRIILDYELHLAAQQSLREAGENGATVKKFEVTTPSFEELTDNEKSGASNNGSGKEYANYLRVSELGDTVFLENDAMEPEDARFSRDLSWVKRAIEYAYECGVKDGKESVFS